MRDNYEKLFTHLVLTEPPEDLLNKIMKRIRQEQRPRALKWRFGFFVAMLFGSVIAAIPTFQSAQSALIASGFARFLSLLFSDTGAVMMYWDSFMVAIIESIPVISITIFLVVILAFLKSLKYITQNIYEF